MDTDVPEYLSCPIPDYVRPASLHIIIPPNDVSFSAGKGHEASQITSSKRPLMIARAANSILIRLENESLT